MMATSLKVEDFRFVCRRRSATLGALTPLHQTKSLVLRKLLKAGPIDRICIGLPAAEPVAQDTSLTESMQTCTADEKEPSIIFLKRAALLRKISSASSSA